MDDQLIRAEPRNVTVALDASICDLAFVAISDARSVHIEARRILADYDRAHPDSPTVARRNSPKR